MSSQKRRREKETARKDANGFFMVWVKDSDLPRIRHERLDQAMKEAARLSEETGKMSVVLNAFCKVETIDGKPVWTQWHEA